MGMEKPMGVWENPWMSKCSPRQAVIRKRHCHCQLIARHKAMAVYSVHSCYWRLNLLIILIIMSLKDFLRQFDNVWLSFNCRKRMNKNTLRDLNAETANKHFFSDKLSKNLLSSIVSTNPTEANLYCLASSMGMYSCLYCNVRVYSRFKVLNLCIENWKMCQRTLTIVPKTW